MPILKFLLNIKPKLAPQKAKKNDNFSHLAKHSFIKKKLCCNPPLDQEVVCSNLCFLKPRTLMLNKKHNLKSGKSKDKKKGFQRENKTENQKRRERVDENKCALEYFDVVPFMKQRPKRQKKKKTKKETKTRNQKKAKKKDKKKERRKRKRERERETEQEQLKRGEAKKAKEKQRETLKKMPFLGGKQFF